VALPRPRRWDEKQNRASDAGPGSPARSAAATTNEDKNDEKEQEMFFIMDIWTFITVKLIWGTLKLAWFLTQTVLWLAVLLITSAVLMVRKRNWPDRLPGTGEFTEDGEGYYWRDDATGALHVAELDNEVTCEVQASERTKMDLRMTAASRLMRSPAIDTSQFNAVVDGTGELAATAEFPQHCYRGVGLDHVDPAQAALAQCDLRFNREQATQALDRLGSILEARGWRRSGDSGMHWYSRTYQRPVIHWEQPVQAAEAPALPALTQ
jgi:hypothetical protein